MFNLDSLKLVLSRTNFSKIFEPTLKNLFPLLVSHTKANQCMSVVVKALSKVESTHARKRCCFLLLAIGFATMAEKNAEYCNKMMDSRDDEDEILHYIFNSYIFSALSKFLPPHFVWSPQWHKMND